MAVSDLSDLTHFDSTVQKSERIQIPNPTTEPVVGVIDTVFKEGTYFSKWVEAHNLVNRNIPGSRDNHGTEVSSIIVDGPAFNPGLDDGCGRFRVRHFGVALGGKMSSFTVIKQIQQIVSTNKDIKVWNLSLGSSQEVSKNFISPEASILDQIQEENDVIFVVAGTNKQESIASRRIGAPADSINALVVNAVDSESKPTSYSRHGPVLSFFNKPDICYFGGEAKKNQWMHVCTPLGEEFVTGTSFAAPWITRKVAYLINIMGLSRELAKALIIDSATGWSKNDNKTGLVGFGVVPIKIDDVLHSSDDEIKFLLTGISTKYDTYAYNIPVPLSADGQYHYIARATLCYFPKCSRNQGVDYTNTELDVHFGRMKSVTGITSINDNKQGDDGPVSLFEKDARREYRKWDNIKQIREISTDRLRPRKSYNLDWGISVKAKERLDQGDGRNLRFGIVVTLKNMEGKNRFETFMDLARRRGWIVNNLNVESQLRLYQQSNSQIDLK